MSLGLDSSVKIAGSLDSSDLKKKKMMTSPALYLRSGGARLLTRLLPRNVYSHNGACWKMQLQSACLTTRSAKSRALPQIVNLVFRMCLLKYGEVAGAGRFQNHGKQPSRSASSRPALPL